MPFILGLSSGGLMFYKSQEKIGLDLEKLHCSLISNARKIELRLAHHERNKVIFQKLDSHSNIF